MEFCVEMPFYPLFKLHSNRINEYEWWVCVCVYGRGGWNWWTSKADHSQKNDTAAEFISEIEKNRITNQDYYKLC